MTDSETPKDLYTNAMDARHSVRDFTPDEVPEEKVKEIEAYCADITTGLLGSKLRWKLFNQKVENRRIGSYGGIRNGNLFIAGCVSHDDEDEHRMKFDFGYQFEKIILKLTTMGLGTCWMAVTYKKDVIQELIGLKDNELQLAASPIGFEAGNTATMGKIVKWFNASKKRNSPSTMFFENGWEVPLFGEGEIDTSAGNYEFALEHLRWAPSAINKQPWRVIKDGEAEKPTFHFFSALDNAYVWIDVGIAVCHFVECLKELGVTGKLEMTDVWKKYEPLPKKHSYIISWTEG